ncbi:hypothetical protein [Halomonas sp. BMC6]|uniref:hypothetical protein n=1 Tax=Halomonas sp. BMC6 TaxID=3073244 RepID=UPI0030CAA2E6
MNINDIKHRAVERIFLIPDASEGQLGYVWCDDPAPGEGMDASEAVEYVRKDVHDAIIKRQAKEAQQGMDAAKAAAYTMEQNASRMYAQCSPEALESEREANAKLTALVAELERERDMHKAAEEAQIALRAKMEADQELNERLAQVEAMRHVANWLSGAIEEGCIGLDLGGEISGPTGCSDADKCRVAGERIFREAARIWECKFVAEVKQ